MAPHSSTLAWRIPWAEEPGMLQSMASLGVGYDWATSLSRIGEGNGNPLQCSCLENPRDGGAWWAAVYGVAQSRTRLKWLSSSSSNIKKGGKINETNLFQPFFLKKIFLDFVCMYTLLDFVYMCKNCYILCVLRVIHQFLYRTNEIWLIWLHLFDF